MAEPLKNSFGPDVPARIGNLIQRVYPAFNREKFLSDALAGFEDLELTERARHISAVLAETLPQDRELAIEILMASVGPENEEAKLTGMESFLYLPHVYFVAENGLECFEASMRAQYELTKRFTAEFSIRSFLMHYPGETLERLQLWATDPNLHVRRLVSEGTRPRLPWAPRLKQFQEDPGLVIELLEVLKDDSEEYVRRSVANNLNDISKDHPDLVVEVARRWWKNATKERKRLVRHGLRTLIKQGHPGALAVLGFSADSPAKVEGVLCTPQTVEIGGRVRVEVEIANPSQDEIGVLVDLLIHFVKARGSTSPKVFKGAELILGPSKKAKVRKTVSVAQQSTRTHYPGTHRIEVMLNGVVYPGGTFKVV